MKKDSPFTSDRFAGFATILRCYEMFQGSLINRLALSVASLVLVAAIGHFTASRVEGQAGPPTHESLQNSVGAVQTTVNSIETKVDNIKAKLDLIPPAWGQILPVSDRFQLVLPDPIHPDGAAVLDKETGLVWSRRPDEREFIFVIAQLHCSVMTLGRRKGWRLPTLQELASLIDPTQANPALPSGHPFSNVQGSFYWSASTLVAYATQSNLATSTNNAWIVDLNTGSVTFGDKAYPIMQHAWCVRGGPGGVDPQ